MKQRSLRLLAALLFTMSTALAQAPAAFNATRAMEYARQLVACGPRYNGSAGLKCAQDYLKKQFARDSLQVDTFVASTPAGPQQMSNLIVRFPGKRAGVIVLATHYETNYPLRTTSFIGANDGAATTALLLEIANHLRGRTLEGYSVWLVFFDGEEAVESWSSTDSLYGSRHLAAKWQVDGTLKTIKGLLLADMIGDRDLDVARVTTATPAMEDLVYEAAKKTGNASQFFQQSVPEEDDHIPFVQRGVPAADVIDPDYGPHDAAHNYDGWHHTPEDTLDKISVKSLKISGDVFLESVRLLNAR